LNINAAEAWEPLGETTESKKMGSPGMELPTGVAT
jgi:hypothetical protein